MKAVNRILRIAFASTLALSQGAWFPALAASHGKHQAVIAISADELKSEYGAGGGGGGTTPAPDPGNPPPTCQTRGICLINPGTGGNTGSCYPVMSHPECAMVPYSSYVANETTTVTEFHIFQGSFNNNTGVTARLGTVYNQTCGLTLDSTVGVGLPPSVAVGVSYSCGEGQSVYMDVPNGRLFNVYRDTSVKTWTQFVMYRWERNGTPLDYIGQRENRYRKVLYLYYSGGII